MPLAGRNGGIPDAPQTPLRPCSYVYVNLSSFPAGKIHAEGVYDFSGAEFKPYKQILIDAFIYLQHTLYSCIGSTVHKTRTTHETRLMNNQLTERNGSAEDVTHPQVRSLAPGYPSRIVGLQIFQSFDTEH